MRRFSFFMLFTLISFFTLAQENTEKAEKLNYIDKKEVKSAERKIVYSNKENEEVKTDDNTTSQPVIIQHLEYNANAEQKKSEDASSSTSGKFNLQPKEQPVPFKEKPVEEQISILDSYINAMQNKISYVKNNPEEDKNAKETGWYDKMDEDLNRAVAKKQELINSKK